jgi:uncharacterized SAM-binding protein YcdF (DUF218 family)
MRKVGLGLVVLALVAYSSFLLWLTWAGKRQDLVHVDCIIVPGARALANGSPGASLEARISHAVELWKGGWAPNLLTTGGRGGSGAIESQVSRRWAELHGVPDAAIAEENQSHTTWQNFIYARDVMRAHGWKSCLISTDPFHEPRCLLIARDLGLEAHAAPTFTGPGWKQTGSWLFYSTRELAAYAKYGLGKFLPLGPS